MTRTRMSRTSTQAAPTSRSTYYSTLRLAVLAVAVAIQHADALHVDSFGVADNTGTNNEYSGYGQPAEVLAPHSRDLGWVMHGSMQHSGEYGGIIAHRGSHGIMIVRGGGRYRTGVSGTAVEGTETASGTPVPVGRTQTRVRASRHHGTVVHHGQHSTTVLHRDVERGAVRHHRDNTAGYSGGRLGRSLEYGNFDGYYDGAQSELEDSDEYYVAPRSLVVQVNRHSGHHGTVVHHGSHGTTVAHGSVHHGTMVRGGAHHGTVVHGGAHHGTVAHHGSHGTTVVRGGGHHGMVYRGSRGLETDSESEYYIGSNNSEYDSMM